MAIAALITWLVTATGGFVMLGTWVSRGGHRPGSDSRLPAGVVFSHFALAAAGLVLWVIYVVAEEEALTWIALGVLAVVALLGFTMFARWLGARGTGAAESRFPVLVVGGHGLFAVATVVLVLLTAVGD